MARLKLGLIGAGSWAVGSHLPALSRRADDVEFLGVSRLGEDQLRKVQSDWGFQMASEDYREVVDAGADVVVVASPAAAHYEHARYALLAGAHVLVEKPFTLVPDHAWELARLAKSLNRHLLVSYGYNYLPLVSSVKAAMMNHRIGDIEAIHVTMSTSTSTLLRTGRFGPDAAISQPDPATWRDVSRSGGGFGQAQLTHALGIALWLGDLRAELVSCLMGPPSELPVELHDAYAIRFEGGAIGTVAGSARESTSDGARDYVSIVLAGRSGQVELEIHHDQAVIRARGSSEKISVPDGGAYNCDGPVDTLVDLAVGRAAVNRSDGRLGARVVEVLAAGYISAQHDGTPTSVRSIQSFSPGIS